MLAENVGHSGGSKLHSERDLPEGITAIQSHRWQLEASVPVCEYALAYVQKWGSMALCVHNWCAGCAGTTTTALPQITRAGPWARPGRCRVHGPNRTVAEPGK